MEYVPVFSHLRLLLVDDDPVQTEFWREALNSYFSLIAVAGSVDQAKGLINGPFDFNVVICDYNLPDSKGLDLLKWLRANFNEKMPFIMITGADELVDSQSDLYFGFMTKPMTPEDILFSVSKFYHPSYMAHFEGSSLRRQAA